VLNAAIDALLERFAGDRGLAIRHATGDRFLAEAAAPRDGRAGVLYQPLGYESAMPLVYAAADLLVGRGGASTVHEVAVTGVPAVLVPWSGAAEDHQTANVAWLADVGAAVLLAESRIGELGDVVERLRGDQAARDQLAANARAMGDVHRSGGLAALVEAVALA
jgi:UDP-N-acetylglucosamine--N-acetylmuramyl-(pentapeptide) pyrophosphoryl-undecaprenol N-acetylglucosamine transferase